MTPRARLIDYVPEMYRTIVPEFFERPLSEERNATCDRCAMCVPEQPIFGVEEYFSPSTKCCTYHPLLPNFAVGGLLLDRSVHSVEGRRRIRAKISARIGVSPLGILPPQKQRLMYRHGKRGFGKSKALGCPYLDQERGMCTVWSHREAVCTTWFCKHNNGLDGLRFWEQLRDYLLSMQMTLMTYALLELGCDVDRALQGISPDLDLDARQLDDEPPDEATYAALWGDWLGREQELYTASFELLRGLDRATFDGLGGMKVKLELDRLQKRYLVMHEPKLPDPLLKNPALRVTRDGDTSYVLTTYSGSDPMRLRKTVFDLLEQFDGRQSTGDVRDAILKQSGLWISDLLLTRLYQHRMLVDPARPTA